MTQIKAKREIFTPLGLKVLVVVFVIWYLALSLNPHFHKTTVELFPFFNWSLFTSTHNIRGDLILKVVSINDQPLEKPTNIMELKNRFPELNSGDISMRKALYTMLNTYAGGDVETGQNMLFEIESRYLAGPSTFEYRLVNVVYDPIERYKDGRIRSETVLLERTVVKN